MHFIGIGNVPSLGTYSLTLGYNLMTINEFSYDRPEVTFSFLIIPRRVVLKLGWRI